MRCWWSLIALFWSREPRAVLRQHFAWRERVHVFTDDAELLARRVSDSHERKAAVELQACATTWLNSVSSRLNAGRKKPPRQRWRIFAP